MKKFLKFLCAVLLLVPSAMCLVACGSGDDDASNGWELGSNIETDRTLWGSSIVAGIDYFARYVPVEENIAVAALNTTVSTPTLNTNENTSDTFKFRMTIKVDGRDTYVLLYYMTKYDVTKETNENVTEILDKYEANSRYTIYGVVKAKTDKSVTGDDEYYTEEIFNFYAYRGTDENGQLKFYSEIILQPYTSYTEASQVLGNTQFHVKGYTLYDKGVTYSVREYDEANEDWTINTLATIKFGTKANVLKSFDVVTKEEFSNVACEVDEYNSENGNLECHLKTDGHTNWTTDPIYGSCDLRCFNSTDIADQLL